MKILPALFAFAILAASASGQAPGQQSETQGKAERLFLARGLDARYSLASHLKPPFFEADFTGDGKPDIAILIKERATGKIGVAICNSGSNAVFILGAGKDFGNGGDNFDWMDSWSLQPKAKLPAKIANMGKCDTLLVEKKESASALICWNGKRYVWRQQGD